MSKTPHFERILIVLGWVSVWILALMGLSLALSPTAIASTITMVEGQRIIRNGQPFHVRGVNYYPADYGWEQMWLSYTQEIVSNQIDIELNKAQELGVNTVRLFIPYRLFSGTTSIEYQDHLVDFINRLEKRDMVAIVTMFDYYPSYALEPYSKTNYMTDTQHIDLVIDALGTDNPTVLAWDIKNELDRDYQQFDSASINSWVREMITHTRTKDPNHLITIGHYGVQTGTLCYDSAVTNVNVFDPAPIVEFAADVDFVSFHYYLSEICFEEAVQTLRTQVPDKPILLEEFGLHTNTQADDPHTEMEQVAYYNALLSLSEAYGLMGEVFWTLNDFSKVPLGFTNIEKCLGILRNPLSDSCEFTTTVAYAPKPAAETIAIHYDPQIAYIDLFDGLVDKNFNVPPAGWSDSSAQGGAIFRGYNPNQPQWSHLPGHVAISKFVTNNISIDGIVTSPLLWQLNIDQAPLLAGEVTSYTVRDAVAGSDSTLYIGVQKGDTITRLHTITSATVFPYKFNIDLTAPPLNWTGEQTFNIVFELAPAEGQNGYSATYELDWIAITEREQIYLPVIMGPPFILDVNSGGDGNFIIRWPSVGTEATYTLFEDNEPTFTKAYIHPLTTARSLNIRGKTYGTHYYKVQAHIPPNKIIESTIHAVNVTHLTIDDFEDGQDPNLIGGVIEQHTDCSSLLLDSYNPINPIVGTYDYRLTYNVTPTCYQTWQTSLKGLDYSGFSYITFYVQGALGNETANIYLQNTPTQRAYVDIEEYINGRITTTPQKVVIPLSRYEEQGVDLKSINWFQVVYEWEYMNGTVYIDGIRFE